jgi:type II secretion system protein G
MSPYASRNRAFTLIELLIVITIIGILAVALIPRLTGGPARARDAQRKSDMQQISTALEFYNTDNNSYPDHSTMSPNNCVSELTLSTSYINSVPSDPSRNPYAVAISNDCATNDGAYTYVAINTDTDPIIESYLLIAHLENSQDRGQGVFNASGFTIQTFANGMASANTLLTSATYNGGRSCYGGTNCSAATDVLYAVGR